MTPKYLPDATLHAAVLARFEACTETTRELAETLGELERLTRETQGLAAKLNRQQVLLRDKLFQ